LRYNTVNRNNHGEFMKIVLLGLLLVVGACGEHTAYVYYPIAAKDGKDGESIKGDKGDSGESIVGPAGQNGYSIVAGSLYDDTACLNAGGTTVTLAQDIDRDGLLSEGDLVQTQFLSCNGIAGQDGNDGLDGINCHVNKVGTQATITCGTNSVVIADGLKGDQGDSIIGPQGIPGTSVEVIPFCPNNADHKEVGLKIGNTVVAFFQQTNSLIVNAPGGQVSVLSGLQGRLTVLKEGVTYSTTAGTNCNFKIVGGLVVN
jgi:hypothetical protein